MISTRGDDAAGQQEDFADETPGVPPAENNSDSDNEQIDDEEGAQKLDTFDKFGRNFVRALVITVEDVGANDNHRQKFLDVLEDCFKHIIRLSNCLTGCQGAVSILHNSFVNQVAYKASQIGESCA